MKVVRRPDSMTLQELVAPYEKRSYTYPDVGATQLQRLPAGYHHVTRKVSLGADHLAFDRAAEALMTWKMHRKAGLTVAASADRAAVGVTTVMAFGSRLAGVLIPCRVLWTVDEPGRCGFAYGTLPGHPERGEEAFVVERINDSVTLSIRAFSKPGDRVVRAASAVGRLVQSRMTDRYGRSLADLARA